MKRRVLLGIGLLPGILGVGFAVYTSAVSAQVSNWPSEGPPQPLPARAVKFPPYEVRTLANGLQVITVAHHEQPAVSMRMVARAGPSRTRQGRLALPT